MLEATTKIHLNLIAEVTSLLSKATMEHWLMGGWALDFMVGRVTRHHDDVDWFVWSKDVTIINTILSKNGYTVMYSGDPGNGSCCRKYGQWLDFTMLEKDQQGNIIMTGCCYGCVLPESAFTGQPKSFKNVTCPIFDVAGQLYLKTEFYQHSNGIPPRVKDLSDIEILRSLMAVGQII